MGGPEMAPHTPRRSARPGKPVARLDFRSRRDFRGNQVGVVDDVERTLVTVRGWIDAARRIVVLTGAGISTDSGIPDFRGPQGVGTKNPEAENMPTIHHSLPDPQL